MASQRNNIRAKFEAHMNTKSPIICKSFATSLLRSIPDDNSVEYAELATILDDIAKIHSTPAGVSDSFAGAKRALLISTLAKINGGLLAKIASVSDSINDPTIKIRSGWKNKKLNNRK